MLLQGEGARSDEVIAHRVENFWTASAIMPPTSPRSSVISPTPCPRTRPSRPSPPPPAGDPPARRTWLPRRRAVAASRSRPPTRPPWADPAVGDAGAMSALRTRSNVPSLRRASTTAFSASMDSRCTAATSASSTPPAVMVARELYYERGGRETAEFCQLCIIDEDARLGRAPAGARARAREARRPAGATIRAPSRRPRVVDDEDRWTEEVARDEQPEISWAEERRLRRMSERASSTTTGGPREPAPPGGPFSGGAPRLARASRPAPIKEYPASIQLGDGAWELQKCHRGVRGTRALIRPRASASRQRRRLHSRRPCTWGIRRSQGLQEECDADYDAVLFELIDGEENLREGGYPSRHEEARDTEETKMRIKITIAIAGTRSCRNSPSRWRPATDARRLADTFELSRATAGRAGPVRRQLVRRGYAQAGAGGLSAGPMRASRRRRRRGPFPAHPSQPCRPRSRRWWSPRRGARGAARCGRRRV